jgi:phosphohistidine phosphatase
MTGFELYLIRHAIADARGPEWPNDAKRPLTELGIARFTEAVKGLREVGVEIDEIFTSPLVRAKQTADILAAGLKHKPHVKILKALEPGHGPAAVVEHLAEEARKKRIALVGHEPDLGDLASHLLGTKKPVPFKKGGVCRIDVATLPTARAGTLVWFLPPKILRTLGEK